MDGILILETNLEVETLSIANTLDNQNLTFNIEQYVQQNGTLPICSDPLNPPDVVFQSISGFFYLKCLGQAVIVLQTQTETLHMPIDRFVVLTGNFLQITLLNPNTQTTLPFIVVHS